MTHFLYNITHRDFIHRNTMTKKEQRTLQRDFFAVAGENLRSFKLMMDTLPDVGFYIKDIEGRIVTLNRRNCEICNLKDEYAAIGQRSDELFPEIQSSVFMSNDQKVIKSGRPLHTVHTRSADGSMRPSNKSVFPVRAADDGRIIGTMCIYRQGEQPKSVDWHGQIKELTSYINAHPTEDLSLAALAKLGKTTPSKLIRMFVKILQTTPAKYVTTMRINIARKLLEKTEMSVSAIAQEAGFYDLSHFIHTFSRIRGITPSRYRKKHKSIATST